MRKGEDAAHAWNDVPELAAKFARRRKKIDIPWISRWLRAIEKRALPVCVEQVMLASFVRRVFRDEELFFDWHRMRKYDEYAKKYFFELDDEELCLTALWLCTYTKHGMPRWPDLWLYVGRGFGKTALMAYWGFCLISPANGIPNYDFDVCATTEVQARLSFDDLWSKFEADAELFSQGFVWNREDIRCLETQSRYKYWSGNSSSKDGMRSGCVAFDEKHAYTTTKSVEVFEGGLGKKPDPRTLTCTTDGDVRDGPLDDDKARAIAVLSGKEHDGGFLPIMHRLDSRDEMADERMWPKANPRLIYSQVLMWEYRRDYEKYRRNPDTHTSVPTKRFNLPETPRVAAVATWDELTDALRDVSIPAGTPCVIGVDFAKTTDMIGACALFDLDGEWASFAHGWFTTQSNDVNAIKAPLDKWADEGLLTITDEAEIAPETIAAWCADVNEVYPVRAIGIDSYRYTIIRRALEEAGFEQYSKRDDTGTVHLVRPMDLWKIQPVVEANLKKRKVAWGNNALMRWCANNVMLVPKPNDNWGYGKQEPHGRKTDVFMAFAHAAAVSDKLEAPEVAPVEMMMPLTF